LVYLDANVFVFATLAKDSLGDASRRILENLRRIDAKTCCLTVDELAWVVLKKVDVATAVKACKAVLSLRELDIVSVEYGDMWNMVEFMQKFRLKPRDAVHLAVMRRLGEKTIVTEDVHFDMAQVKRVSIEKFAESL
jgi:predicted nucleic acid-binding protein